MQEFGGSGFTCFDYLWTYSGDIMSVYADRQEFQFFSSIEKLFLVGIFWTFNFGQVHTQNWSVFCMHSNLPFSLKILVESQAKPLPGSISAWERQTGKKCHFNQAVCSEAAFYSKVDFISVYKEQCSVTSGREAVLSIFCINWVYFVCID